MLRLKVDTTTFTTKAHGEVPHLLATAIFNPATGALSLFALNRSTDEAMDIALDLRGLGSGLRVASTTELHDQDLKKANSKAAPDARCTSPEHDGDYRKWRLPGAIEATVVECFRARSGVKAPRFPLGKHLFGLARRGFLHLSNKFYGKPLNSCDNYLAAIVTFVNFS